MAETKIVERIISGVGLLRIPPDESAIRYYSLLVDVIRLPANIDRSFRYNPYRQRFSTAVFLRNGYVIDERAIDYVKRRFDYPINEPGQVLIALKCAHKQLLTLVGGASPPTSIIETFANLDLMWDEVRFVCHDSTAIKVSLWQDLYDECSDDYREKSPPPPPVQPPPDENDTPISDISPPYEDNDNVTEKNPDDEYFEEPPPEFPQGNQCSGYNVSIQWIINGSTVIQTNSIGAFGKIEFVGLDPANPLRLIIICYGDVFAPGASCRSTPITLPLATSSIGFIESSIAYTITPL